MKKVDSLVGPAIAIIGLAAFGFGIYLTNFSSLCAPGEPAIVCLRSWIAVIGPIAAILALIIALSQFSPFSGERAAATPCICGGHRRIIPTSESYRGRPRDPGASSSEE